MFGMRDMNLLIINAQRRAMPLYYACFENWANPFSAGARRNHPARAAIKLKPAQTSRAREAPNILAKLPINRLPRGVLPANTNMYTDIILPRNRLGVTV